MGRGRWSRLVLLAGVLAALAGGATAAASVGRDANHSAGAPWRVGVVYSRTGLLAAYGAEYVEGLKLGLDYATNGTDQVAGRKVQLSLVADGTDPTKAVRAAGQGLGRRPDLRRVGGLDRARDVEGAAAAGRLQRQYEGGHRPRREGDVAHVRPGGLQHRFPLALRLDCSEEQGQRLARGQDEAAQPDPRPVHAGRVRRRADGRA